MDTEVKPEIIEFEGKKLSKFKGLKCPLCDSDMIVSIADYDIMDFGKVNLYSYNCTKCNYKSSEMVPTETKPSAIYTINITKPEDLYIKLIRGSDTSIEIEGLDISLEPGGNAAFFYTNIESILNKFDDAVQSMRRNHYLLLKDDKYANDFDKITQEIAVLDDLVKQIYEFKQVKKPFKLVLTTPKGYGAILDKRAIYKQI